MKRNVKALLDAVRKDPAALKEISRTFVREALKDPDTREYARQTLGIGGSVLSDIDILKYMEMKEDPLVIKPAIDNYMWTDDGIDLRLSNTFYVPKPKSQLEPIDTLTVSLDEEEHKTKYGRAIEINAGVAYRFLTLQQVRMPRDLTARLEPRTKNLRTGLRVRCEGSVDPGYGGPLSVIVSNEGDHANKLVVYPLQRVVKIQFYKLSSPAMYGYQTRSGKYSAENAAARPDTKKEIMLIQKGDFKSLADMVLDVEETIKQYDSGEYKDPF